MWFSLYRAKSYTQPTLSSGKFPSQLWRSPAFLNTFQAVTTISRIPLRYHTCLGHFLLFAICFCTEKTKILIGNLLCILISENRFSFEAARAKEPAASTGNNFQGLKYGFCHLGSGERKRKKFLFNQLCSSLAETESKENLRLLGIIKMIQFFNRKCKNA